jgi:hypothetical protein
VSFWD